MKIKKINKLIIINGVIYTPFELILFLLGIITAILLCSCCIKYLFF